MNAFEKIKERLEEASWFTMPTFDCDGYSNDDSEEVVMLDKALEIVNQVAEEYSNSEIPNMSEDVCEWFKYDYRTIAPKNHDVDNPYWRIPENMDKLKFCPYCGKKIKVVE